MSKRNLQIDQTFDKFLAEHVVKNGRMSFCISIRGSQAVISGEQEIVALAEENLETITLKDIVENMKRIEKHDTVKHFKTSQKVDFPPMEVKFKGQLWTTKKARMQLSTYLNILGFGKKGNKKFKEASDEPAGWPQEHSFETFPHPSYATLDVANDIIESIMRHHGFDAANHPFETKEPEATIQKKRKRKDYPRDIIEEHSDAENDLNDNSFNEGEEIEETPNLKRFRVGDDDYETLDIDEEVVTEGKKADAVLSPYELLREQNIKEKEEFFKKNGILPISEAGNLDK